MCPQVVNLTLYRHNLQGPSDACKCRRFDLISIVPMIPGCSLLKYLVLVAVVSVTLPGQNTEPVTPAPPLSLDEVVQLSQSGISEELIITKVKKNGKAFDLSPEELMDLKKAGVSDNIVKYLLDPSQPYSPPPPPAAPSGTSQPSASVPPAAPAKQYPKDPYASKVPSDPALYHFIGNDPTEIDLKMLLGESTGKMLMKKGKTIAYLVGRSAKIRLHEPSPVFYLRLPDGKSIEEVVLVALEGKGGRRQVEVGSGQKEELKPAVMRPFDSLEIGARLFRITPGKLANGEYLFFFVGAAEPAKGNYGKGYDFGIEQPAPPPVSKK